MRRSEHRTVSEWLRRELPELVGKKIITAEAARAIEEYHAAHQTSTRNFAVVILAVIGSVLVASGIVLLIAHNWDQLSRTVRCAIALLPLLASQLLVIFVLLCRKESQAWRETVAIFNAAAVGTAISLISQTYQIQGSLADFLRVWMMLTIPVIYLLRTTFGAVAYLIGSIAWLLSNSFESSGMEQLYFWPLLFLVIPYCVAVFRPDRAGGETRALFFFLVAATAAGLGFTADLSKLEIGAIAFAGLATTVYLVAALFFSKTEHPELHPLTMFGGIGVAIVAIALSFKVLWNLNTEGTFRISGPVQATCAAIELLFPIAALSLLIFAFVRRKIQRFSVIAALLPVIAITAWTIVNYLQHTEPLFQGFHARVIDHSGQSWASLLLNVYTLTLGIDFLRRGLQANSITRANLGLAVIAALATCRFFDSDISFVTRGVGFVVIGLGFLAANLVIFKKRVAT